MHFWFELDISFFHIIKEKSLSFYLRVLYMSISDDPIVVAILDGRTLQMFLEDEDDFAMLAENLFTELDTEDRGKIARDEIQGALANMGVESGVPPKPGMLSLSVYIMLYAIRFRNMFKIYNCPKVIEPVGFCCCS